MTEDGGDPNGKGDGYGRPPIQHRIKTGEVRNPFGRKGKPGSKKTDFLDELFEFRQDGIPVKMTRRRAVDLGLFHAALQGNVSAAKELDRRARERARAAEDDANDDALAPDRQAALDHFAQRRVKELEARKVTSGEAPKSVPGDKNG